MNTVATMTKHGFKRWQKRMGWSVSKTARELCLQERQVYSYRSGEATIPPMTERMCQLLEHIYSAPVSKPAD